MNIALPQWRALSEKDRKRVVCQATQPVRCRKHAVLAECVPVPGSAPAFYYWCPAHAAAWMNAFPKPVPLDDENYLRYIRRQPCILTHCASQAHHVVPPGGGKTGAKVSDYRTVPLASRLHREYHRIGREAFEVKYNVDLDLEQIRFLEQYLSALKDGEDLGERT